MQNRRKFIQTSAVAGAGLVLSGGLLSACSPQKKEAKTNSEYLPFGLQLWSVQQEMGDDPAKTLTALSGFGYKQIESFEGAQGIYWGMSPKDFVTFLSDLDMRVVSSHCDVFNSLEEKADQAAEAGIDYLICPHLGADDSLDFYKESAEKFSRFAEICKSAGVGFAYHNHDYSFRKVEGEYPQVVMMEYASEDVYYELDAYWVVAAGLDATEWFKKYEGRWKLVHIKDREDLPLITTHASTILGTGTIDFTPYFDAHRAGTLPYLIVEQERFEGTTPMEAAEANAAYMMEALKV